MSKLQELHAIVQAMGKGEKKAFSQATERLHRSQTGQLYELLAKYPIWEEAELLKKIEAQGLKAHLPTHMIRLRRTLFAHLGKQNSDKRVATRLQRALFEIEWLYRRGLLPQIAARIRQARKLARKYSRLPEELQLLTWEQKVLLELQPRSIVKALQAVQASEAETLARYQLQRTAARLHFQMRSLAREVLQPRSPSEQDRYRANINNHQQHGEELSPGQQKNTRSIKEGEDQKQYRVHGIAGGHNHNGAAHNHGGKDVK